jgi:hypothetical protein
MRQIATQLSPRVHCSSYQSSQYLKSMMFRPPYSWIALVVVFVTLSRPVHAQGTDIRGTVVDSSTGERVPFASVIVQGTQRGAATNLNGFFLIANVPPGTYQVAAGAVGYTRQVRTVVVRAAEPVTIEFRIVPEAVEMEEVWCGNRRTAN